MSKLTPENEKLLRSYKNIAKALGLSPNSREYFEFKKMMSEDELTVLRWLKKEVSQQNHIANRINGTVSATNRGRKKKEQTDAPVAEATDQPMTLVEQPPAPSVAEMQPYTSSVEEMQPPASSVVGMQPLENQKQ
jgi:hypothetical protein